MLLRQELIFGLPPQLAFLEILSVDINGALILEVGIFFSDNWQLDRFHKAIKVSLLHLTDAAQEDKINSK